MVSSSDTTMTVSVAGVLVEVVVVDFSGVGVAFVDGISVLEIAQASAGRCITTCVKKMKKPVPHYVIRSAVSDIEL